MYHRIQQKLQEIQASLQKELDDRQTMTLGSQGNAPSPSPFPAPSMSIPASTPVPDRADREDPRVQAPDEDLIQMLGAVKQIWSQLQQQPPTHPRWQSLQTEIHKQLRLAEIDIRFWSAARQSETALRRGQQLSDRLSTLIGYCDAGMELEQQNSGEA